MKSRFIAAGLAVTLACALVSHAALTPVSGSDFLPGTPVVTFETGSHALPSVAGLSFLTAGSPSPFNPWYGSSANFNGFFGTQGWSNTVSFPAEGTTYGDLGCDFNPPVQAVGGYVGQIPNFTGQNAPKVLVELYNSSLSSLGTAAITLSIVPAFDLTGPVFFGFRADEPIARFRMTGDNHGFFSVDNFMFGSVPEPASATLVLVGLGALRRSRR